RFAVTFYSLSPANPGYQPDGFRFRAPPAAIVRAGIRGSRWLALAGLFGADQVRSGRCDAVLSFWGYPMGAFAVTLAGLARRPSAWMWRGAKPAALPAIDYGHLREPGARRRLFRACARAG